MFEEFTVRAEYEDVTEWSFNFLISVAKAIHDWKSLYGEYPESVSISKKSYGKLMASPELVHWFKDGELTSTFHGVKIVVLEWDGEYMSMRKKKGD